MFNNLNEKLQNIISKTRTQELTQDNMQEALREIRRALLEADVNFKIVKEFIKVIEEKALGQDVLKSLTPGQQVIKIVKDELVALLGGEESKINFTPNPPTVIMLVGLQGSRKNNYGWKACKPIKKTRQKTITCCM